MLSISINIKLTILISINCDHTEFFMCNDFVPEFILTFQRALEVENIPRKCVISDIYISDFVIYQDWVFFSTYI